MEQNSLKYNMKFAMVIFIFFDFLVNIMASDHSYINEYTHSVKRYSRKFNTFM